MATSFVSETESIGVKAALTAGAFYAVDKYGYNASDDKQLMRVAACGASQAGADLSEKTVGAYVLTGESSEQFKNALNPVLTGAIYVASNQALKNDNKSLAYQFLHAAGSSLVGNQAEPFVKKSLGM